MQRFFILHIFIKQWHTIKIIYQQVLFFININFIKNMLFKSKIVCVLLFCTYVAKLCCLSKTAVSLDEAAASNKKVLITDRKLKPKKVEQINGTYYGY
jgi:hypothetical protein